MAGDLPAIAVAAVAAGAVSQGVTGIGFSLVCAPFLIAALGPRDGVRTALVLSSALNIALIARDHRRVLVREGLALLVPAVLATPVLAWALSHVRSSVLTATAGVLTIVSAAVLASGVRWHMARGLGGAAVAGVVSAAMNLIGSIGGPAAAIYAVNAEWPPARMRPTLQTFFLVTNVVAIASLGIIAVSPVLFVALAVGWLGGLALSGRVPDHAARAATLSVAAAGGVVAVLHAVL